MYLYKVTANSDWGVITDRATVEASSFKAAFGKAGRACIHLIRRRNPKFVTIRLDKIGRKEKAPSAENA